MARPNPYNAPAARDLAEIPFFAEPTSWAVLLSSACLAGFLWFDLNYLALLLAAPGRSYGALDGCIATVHLPGLVPLVLFGSYGGCASEVYRHPTLAPLLYFGGGIVAWTSGAYIVGRFIDVVQRDDHLYS